MSIDRNVFGRIKGEGVEEATECAATGVKVSPGDSVRYHLGDGWFVRVRAGKTHLVSDDVIAMWIAELPQGRAKKSAEPVESPASKQE